MPKIYFTPGPSQLYFTVQEHLRRALREDIPSISHRSTKFQNIYAEAVDNISALLNLPSGYKILFTASATEAWERIIQNLVERESFHLVNGAFSARFHEISQQLGRTALSAEAAEGSVVEMSSLLIPESTELIAITHNETSTGARQPEKDVESIRKAFPNQLIALDVVSSVPDAEINYNHVDTAYFSVQKAFGLPAGLGVWIVNDRCIEKSAQLQESGTITGSYHSISAMLEKAVKNQTPETPNVLGIYLLGRVAGDMLEKGLDQIRRETAYKSAMLYHTYENHPRLRAFVTNPEQRSRTTTVAHVDSGSPELISYLSSRGFIVGSGYGKYKSDHIRIANFPTHSKEQIEMLADYLSAWKQ
ncbi:aminotransferase class V-fold PLP-dependent enzyme [Fulvivirga sedimenti]|uniref:phosphoserine transaminase n=1 Tax=Fulvivirga sedimenti TaxID=2879465 RepID=A0A9X1HTP2_9BACT|nr:aminotransferase class V-fold PLP-dependent enzyme [Fulvivirga sedimenti]MCA6074775.1 aminotransferase class V-fold PLP-dependent enzyme [Fulvivirga sedimenti]MCA6075952.1 aminotransferase class V-fold PLP-dependent enzyme [Fulvivirga sedimenti]MCA6077080.1 aminotransferase class V-fold PLP-dependent enzyme [Fulvivirga sedimenti]